VLAGTNQSRNWPAYFEHGFDVPVQRLASPGFVFSGHRAVNLPATLWQVVTRMGEFRASLRTLTEARRRTAPDLVVNFLEPLVGLLSSGGAAAVPVLAVGHQFLLNHPDYVKLPTQQIEQWGLRQYLAATGRGAVRYALSFYQASDDLPAGRIVGPPLLRDELFRFETQEEDFLLVYLLNDGYRADLERWHMRRPQVPIHCYYDRPGAPESEAVDATLTFHRLHGERFRGVACTAGFESISEAAWLGKPVFAVPVDGHVEQALNALDAEQCGLGLAGRGFDLDRLLEAPPRRAARTRFRDWLARSDERLGYAMEFAIRRAHSPSTPRRQLRPMLAK